MSDFTDYQDAVTALQTAATEASLSGVAGSVAQHLAAVSALEAAHEPNSTANKRLALATVFHTAGDVQAAIGNSEPTPEVTKANADALNHLGDALTGS